MAQISIVNAASRAGGAVSPGMVVVIAVPGMGPAEAVTTQLRSIDRLAMQLGETRVLFDGTAAPMCMPRAASAADRALCSSGKEQHRGSDRIQRSAVEQRNCARGPKLAGSLLGRLFR